MTRPSERLKAISEYNTVLAEVMIILDELWENVHIVEENRKYCLACTAPWELHHLNEEKKLIHPTQTL